MWTDAFVTLGKKSRLESMDHMVWVGRILAPMISAPTLGDTPVNMLYYKRDLGDGIKVANQQTVG